MVRIGFRFLFFAKIQQRNENERRNTENNLNPHSWEMQIALKNTDFHKNSFTDSHEM